MSSLFLLIAYMAVFVSHIILLIFAIRENHKNLWRYHLLSEGISSVIATALMFYFNSLPGHGFMPGLTYLGEILCSFAAAVLYAIMLIVSICTLVVIKVRTRKATNQMAKSGEEWSEMEKECHD